MPVVTIETWPMDEERKPIVIKGITDVFAGLGVPPEAVTVVIHETGLSNWGSAGEQHSVKFKNLKR